MTGNLLLDTNVIIRLLRHSEPAIETRLMQYTVLFVPVIVVGEMYYGVEKSKQRHPNEAELAEFLATVTVLNIDQTVARRYGAVRRSLELKTKAIPQNDLWIAAIALENDLTLATSDQHFDVVDQLRIERI
jgi:tRNA(fMet)-specific endonuclease VapC